MKCFPNIVNTISPIYLRRVSVTFFNHFCREKKVTYKHFDKTVFLLNSFHWLDTVFPPTLQKIQASSPLPDIKELKADSIQHIFTY